MPVTVFPPISSNAAAEPVTVDVAQSWRLGANGSLQLLDQTLFTVAEWAANQWGWVQIGGGA
jgi:hypothetical protein